MCRKTIEEHLTITLLRRGKETSPQRTISPSCMSTVVECPRIFDKPWIGIGALPKAGMLSRNATWAHFIFGVKALHRITPRQPSGFEKPPRVATPPASRSLRGCISAGKVYLGTTEWLCTGCNWPPTVGTRAPKLISRYLYEQGQGVPLDYVMAYMWYEAAQAGGEQRASERLRILSKLMTKEQISRAVTSFQALSISTHGGEAVEHSQRIGNAFNREP